MNVPRRLQPLIKRCIATSSVSRSGENQGFFGSFFGPRKPIEAQSSSHSQSLSGKDDLIELQTHNVKPDALDKYAAAHKRLCEFFKANDTDGLKLNCKCIGNFNVFVGEQDQFIHIWRFKEGYNTLDDGNRLLKSNSEYK